MCVWDPETGELLARGRGHDSREIRSLQAYEPGLDTDEVRLGALSGRASLA
jgi:hypothetical protein